MGYWWAKQFGAENTFLAQDSEPEHVLCTEVRVWLPVLKIQIDKMEGTKVKKLPRVPENSLKKQKYQVLKAVEAIYNREDEASAWKENTI